VIERLVSFYNQESAGEELPALEVPTKQIAGRLYSNAQVQRLICKTAAELPFEELDRLCSKEYSRKQLGLSFPLFLRVSERSNDAQRTKAIQDSKGRNRWTWKYSFNRDGYAFAICTQWFPKHDPLVRDWLKKHES
jgi:hypothetical protein